jgi:hypothetical protein
MYRRHNYLDQSSGRWKSSLETNAGNWPNWTGRIVSVCKTAKDDGKKPRKPGVLTKLVLGVVIVRGAWWARQDYGNPLMSKG